MLEYLGFCLNLAARRLSHMFKQPRANLSDAFGSSYDIASR